MNIVDAYATAKHLFERASHRVPNIEIESHNGKGIVQQLVHLLFHDRFQCKITKQTE